MRRQMIVMVVLVVVVGLTTAACASDPTSSPEYADLEEELAALADERDDLAADLDATISDLTAAVEDGQAAKADAEAAASDREAALQRRDELERSLATAATSLDEAFDLTALEVALWLSCTDPAVVETLSDDIVEMREQVAVAAHWFDSAADYDVCDSQRAWANADNAVTRQHNTELTEAWDRYWDADPGSEEESRAFYEFSLRRLFEALDSIDSARSVVDDAVPDSLENADEA